MERNQGLDNLDLCCRVAAFPSPLSAEPLSGARAATESFGICAMSPEASQGSGSVMGRPGCCSRPAWVAQYRQWARGAYSALLLHFRYHRPSRRAPQSLFFPEVPSRAFIQGWLGAHMGWGLGAPNLFLFRPQRVLDHRSLCSGQSSHATELAGRMGVLL